MSAAQHLRVAAVVRRLPDTCCGCGAWSPRPPSLSASEQAHCAGHLHPPGLRAYCRRRRVRWLVLPMPRLPLRPGMMVVAVRSGVMPFVPVPSLFCVQSVVTNTTVGPHSEGTGSPEPGGATLLVCRRQGRHWIESALLVRVSRK